MASTATATRAWGTKPTVTAANSADVGQQWFFLTNKDSSNNPIGSYRLVNRYSGLVLGMSSDSSRLAESTPPRSWANSTGNPVGGTRNETEQALTFTAVGTSGGQNVALNKPASAQSAQGSRVASLAVDGDPTNNSYWSADPYAQWWKVDLQSLYTLSSVSITNYVDGSRYYQYNIQASTDWTTIATKSNTAVATSAGDSYPVNVQARYLRVNITFNSANAGVHIANFTATGS
ncbi:discoidin domain-containing protein [Longispora sp. K20-0274]|uniref:discoidin domain-containing protein n=1 Tax=Longispora sp. K20-0274 TaxID=3088255 RepID=UPI0039995726